MMRQEREADAEDDGVPRWDESEPLDDLEAVALTAARLRELLGDPR